MHESRQLIWTRSVADWEFDKKLLKPTRWLNTRSTVESFPSFADSAASFLPACAQTKGSSLDSNSTHGRLQAKTEIQAGDFELLHLPCLRLSNLKNIEIPELPNSVEKVPFAQVIITFASTSAVAVTFQNPVLRTIVMRASAIYCVGEKTALKVRQFISSEALSQGLLTERYESLAKIRWVDMKSMAKTMTAEIPRTSIVIAPGACLRSFDLKTWCESQGITCHRIDLYENKTGLRNYLDKHLTQGEIHELQHKLDGVVCFASPSAVRGFVDYLDPAHNGLAQRLTAICIGKTTENTASEYFDVSEIAATADIHSLIMTARNYL